MISRAAFSRPDGSAQSFLPQYPKKDARPKHASPSEARTLPASSDVLTKAGQVRIPNHMTERSPA